MVDWNSWGPTLISVATGLIMVGSLFAKVGNHEKKLSDHDKKISDLEKTEGLQNVALAELQAWRAGYEAATSKHSS